jgi:hypothetical protein
MKKKSYFLLLIATSILASCTTDSDIKVPEVEPEVVVSCFISPQEDTLKAFVRLTDPLFGSSQVNGNSLIEGATVKIKNGTSEAIFTLNTEKERYELAASDFPINSGTTYQLEVSVPGYDLCSASTTVPSNSPVFNLAELIQIDTLSENQGSGINGNFKFKWNDPSGQTNYYRLVISQKITYQIDTGIFEEYYSNIWDELIDDANKDGDEISKEPNTYIYQSYDPDNPTALKFYCYLLNTDEAYFRYHYSVWNVQPGNPFAEPSIIYDNINNGLGAFGSSNGVLSIIED